MKREIQFLGFAIALVVIIVMLFICSVSAMETRDINQRIYLAETALKVAKKELSSRDRTLFLTYVTHPYSVSGHIAETKLREKYPAEYSRYIKAKINLDDLQYEKFLMFANAEHDKEV